MPARPGGAGVVGQPGDGVGPLGRRQLVDQRVLGRQHHVGGAEQRVGPGGEHLDGRACGPVERGGGEAHQGALGPPDPVPLLQLDGLGPVEGVEVCDQPVGVRGDAHHPLTQRPLEHGEVPALAATVGGDLLVGQHGAQTRAPVDRRLVDVGQAMVVDHHPSLGRRQLGPRPPGRVGALGRLACAGVELGHQVVDGPGAVGLGVVPGVEDLQEDPLGPPVVALVDRRDRPARVVGQAQSPELAPHRGDVRLGGDAGVLPRLHRVLLGRQAEGVVAHGVHDVVSRHALVPGVHVGADVSQRVADVEAGAAGVGEHVQHVELGLVGDLVEAGAQVTDRVRAEERALALPPVLPGGLDLTGERGRVAVRGRVGPGGLCARRLRLGHDREGYRPVVAGPEAETGRRLGRWGETCVTCHSAV